MQRCRVTNVAVDTAVCDNANENSGIFVTLDSVQQRSDENGDDDDDDSASTNTERLAAKTNVPTNAPMNALTNN